MPIDNAFATHPEKQRRQAKRKTRILRTLGLRTQSAIRSSPTATAGVTFSTLPHLQSMRSNALLTAIRSRE